MNRLQLLFKLYRLFTDVADLSEIESPAEVIEAPDPPSAVLRGTCPVPEIEAKQTGGSDGLPAEFVEVDGERVGLSFARNRGLYVRLEPVAKPVSDEVAAISHRHKCSRFNPTLAT
jgi:hypothetical protein